MICKLDLSDVHTQPYPTLAPNQLRTQVKHKELSAIDTSHRRAVSDLCWLPGACVHSSQHVFALSQYLTACQCPLVDPVLHSRHHLCYLTTCCRFYGGEQ